MSIQPHGGFMKVEIGGKQLTAKSASFYIPGSRPTWQRVRFTADKSKTVWVRNGPPDEWGNFVAFHEDGIPFPLVNIAEIELVGEFANWVSA